MYFFTLTENKKNTLENIFKKTNQYLSDIKIHMQNILDLDILVHTYFLDTFCYTELAFSSFDIEKYNVSPLYIHFQVNRDTHRFTYIIQSLQNLFEKDYHSFRQALHLDENSISLSETEYSNMKNDVLSIIDKIAQKKQEFLEIFE